MSDTKLQDIEAKLQRGEDLSADELKEVMSAPNNDITNSMLAPEDDIPEDAFADDSDPAPKEEKVAPAKKEAPVPAAKEAKKEEKKEESTLDDSLNKLEAELSKPEGQENLEDFNAREKAYFWQMRRDRRAKQKAEADLDAFRLKEVQRRATEDAALKAAPAKEEKTTKDPFEGRAADDMVTVQDLKNLVGALKTESPQKPKEEPAKGQMDVENPFFQAGLKSMDREARTELGDQYDEVMECSAEIIQSSPLYQRQIADALVKGENIAKVIFHIIKGDPEFTKVLPVAQARLKAAGKLKPSEGKEDPAPKADDTKTKEALKAQAKLEEKKPKTSVNSSGSEAGAENKIDGYDINDMIKMSSREFSKIPKKTRDEFLRRFGS